MWTHLLALAARFWRIADAVERNKAEIAQLRQEVREIGRVLDWVLFDLREARHREAIEREKLVLRLENDLLELEHRFPPPRSRSWRVA